MVVFVIVEYVIIFCNIYVCLTRTYFSCSLHVLLKQCEVDVTHSKRQTQIMSVNKYTVIKYA